MKKSWIGIFALMCLFFCCKKETTTTVGVVMTYTMTQCDDPWQDETYFKDKALGLKTYLEKQGIVPQELSVALDSECAKNVVCAACFCTSCYNATVKVDAKDVAAMEKLKFVKK
jgi:hypothetical protein